VPPLWRSGAALDVVHEHLAPGGALYVFNQAPGWKRALDARDFGEQVVAALVRHGFSAGEPRVEELVSGPVTCVVARPAGRASAG
jgi:hypothetical protein